MYNLIQYASGPIKIYNLPIHLYDTVNEFYFLGLYINSKLNWDTHTNFIGKRISRAVGVIKKMQLIFPKSVLITIYNALILPHINDCLLSWGLDTSVKSIFMQQKKRNSSYFLSRL